MQCDKTYVSLISGHLDGTNSEIEEKRLQQHLKSCRHCRELLEIMEGNDILLAQSTQQPPEDLTQRIMNAVAKEPRKQNKRKRFYFSTIAAGLATAAMLCFALLGDNLPPLPASKEEVNAELTVYGSSEQKDIDTAILEMPQDAAIDDGEDVPFEDSTAPRKETVIAPDSSSDNIPATEPSEIVPASEPTVQNSEAIPSETEEVAPTETQESFTLPTADISSIHGYAPVGKDFTGGQFSTRYSYSGGVPTLVIWDVTAQELRLPFSAVKTEFSAKSASPVRPSLYDHFASTLFALSHSTFSASDGSQFITPSYETELYTVGYKELCEFFRSCTGKYELAIYFPKNMENVEDCQIILIASAKNSEKSSSGYSAE